MVEYSAVTPSERQSNSTETKWSCNSKAQSKDIRGRDSKTITYYDVSKRFKLVNLRKAAGPDGIPSCFLRACADQLAGVFMDIFNLSLPQCTVPTCLSTIIPVTKKAKVSELNDYSND
jgi:hypothetical protein